MLLLCIMFITACQLLERDIAINHSTTFSEKQFCQFTLSYIREQEHMMDYCYKYPSSVFVHLDWYWLYQSILLRYVYGDHTVVRIEQEIEDVLEEIALDPNKPIVYLTFDDGPGKYTDKVLDILKEEQIKATFFVLGQQVERNPLFTKRIIEEGHTVGNHTYNHNYKEIYNSFEQFAEQIIQTNKIVYELTGYKITLFRAPGGSINNLDEGYFKALESAGFTVYDWNIDTRDSIVRGITSEQVLQHVTESSLFNPAIVLLHDTNRHEQSMLALPSIISYYRELGYQFAPITASTQPVTFNLGKKLNWSRASVTDRQIEEFTLKNLEIYK